MSARRRKRRSTASSSTANDRWPTDWLTSLTAADTAYIDETLGRPSICLSVCLFVPLSDCLSLCLSLCLSVCPSGNLCHSVCLSVCLSLCLSGWSSWRPTNSVKALKDLIIQCEAEKRNQFSFVCMFFNTWQKLVSFSHTLSLRKVDLRCESKKTRHLTLAHNFTKY